MNIFFCRRCGHVWESRMILPNVCAAQECHSPYWNLDELPKRVYSPLPVETKNKISLSLKGKPHSIEHNLKVKAALSTEEARERMRSRRLGAIASVATRAKLSLLKRGNSNMLGHKHTEDTKRKMSMARKGIVFSEETRIRISHGGIGKHDGCKNPSWKGGVSFGPYCPKFNRDFKERVRAFFGYVCQGCGKHQDIVGKKLDVHHVTYNKNSCCDHSKPLFVPLCRSCHGKTKGSPEFYERKYTELIMTTYKGRCYTEKL